MHLGYHNIPWSIPWDEGNQNSGKNDDVDPATIHGDKYRMLILISFEIK
jgi:hypothetical protein